MSADAKRSKVSCEGENVTIRSIRQFNEIVENAVAAKKRWRTIGNLASEISSSSYAE
jgi:hypothetical protein